MARLNREIAKSAVRMLLAARGYTDIDFTADDKLTAIAPDGKEIAAVVTSRIIGEETRESDVISAAPTKRAAFDRYFATDLPADAARRLMFVADIDADLRRIRIAGFDYDDLDLTLCANDAINTKTNGGIAFNFARFDELKTDADESGVVAIGD